MRKQLLVFLTAIFCLNGYSQISFEKGYFIDNSGQKIDCLIRNVDWKNNPTDFEYKASESSEIINTNIKSVKEFGIYKASKYIRSTVKIDKSSENISDLNYDRNPVYVEETLFLKVLVEGKSTLFLYENSSLVRFFYNNDNSNIEQLVYKSYLVSENHEIGRNNLFKNQLWNNLKCPTIGLDKIEKLKYEKNCLIKFFTEYNKCNNSAFINYEAKEKRDLFNLTLRPHINNTSLSIENSISNQYNTNFGSKLGFGFGVEAEFILPYNKNKWALVIEPTYQNFKSEKTNDVSTISGGKLISNVDYSSIEVPFSLRHYLFLNSNSKMFINASYIFDFRLKSSIEFKRADNSNLSSIDFKAHSNFAFGVGYKFQDKYSMEMRYQTTRNILANYRYWSSNYETVSIIFGYSFF